MKSFFLLTFITLATQALADDCRTVLTIETNDPIYPGHGEVQVCTNQSSQLTKLNVIKPVEDPTTRYPTSSQPDERKPVIQITLEELNQAKRDIPLMTPHRYGITVTAAYLGVPTAPIQRDSGGEVVLKVLKNKLTNSYYHFRLKLLKSDGDWRAFLVTPTQKTPVSHAFFTSGLSGIKKVDFY